jgi:hypothetical protein
MSLVRVRAIAMKIMAHRNVQRKIRGILSYGA